MYRLGLQNEAKDYKGVRLIQCDIEKNNKQHF